MTIDIKMVPCRCCGKPVPAWLANPNEEVSICTTCIPRHWTKHCYGINASRCKEFKEKGERRKRNLQHMEHLRKVGQHNACVRSLRRAQKEG